MKVALLCFCITGEGCLWLLLFQLVQYLLVRNITNLEVFFDQLSILVTNATLTLRHHGITSIICLANIAVDASPTVVTLTLSLAAAW